MKENFLYFVWQYYLLNTTNLKTTKNQSIIIHNPGVRNAFSGPDYVNAKISIDNQLWAGNVEMHVKSSDWYLHHHEQDNHYNAVILHVVWEHDADVFLPYNQIIPTLQLKHVISKDLVAKYNKLNQSVSNWIPCQNQITMVDDFVMEHWKERLFFERLENKSKVIQADLKISNNNYEAVFIRQIARCFGSNINGEAFFKLFHSFDISILRKIGSNSFQIEALLFGQAGFLNEDIEHHYFRKLLREYHYLAAKFQLKPMQGEVFQFFKLRPNNFPTVRLAQLSALLSKHQQIFSTLMAMEKRTDFYSFFSITVNPFWKNHYTFATPSNNSLKKLSTSFVDLILINAIIPMKLTYLIHKGVDFEEGILKIIRQLSPEKNTIISKFSDLKIISKNAMDTQALLELKNNYCAKQKCLQCAIGVQLMKF